ncbi:amino acid permease [Streptomyces sp. NPDC048436]|uniref:amino acid permease n=1 Tax=Streptomyces sp. NPDC048436 TaxID=3365550 RepID=UPI003718C30D
MPTPLRDPAPGTPGMALSQPEPPVAPPALTQRHLTMMAMGGAVGTGLFVGSAETIRAAGPGALLSYALAGLLVLMVMRMLGEMVVARPLAGSFADYARLALGDWAGFTIGWLYWYAFVAIVAIEAIAGGRILHGWLPAAPAWTLSLLVLAVMATVNLVSVRSFGNAELWLSVVKVGAILTFLALGGAYVLGWWPGGDGADLSAVTGDFLPHGAGAVLTGTVAVVFAFGGTEIVTIAAAESADPARAVARATRQVVWRIALFFLCSVFLVVAIVPWREVRPAHSPYVGAMEVMGIPYAGTVMTVIILTALLSVLNSTLYASSRMLFALCAHGDAPRRLVRTNQRGVPVRAVLLGTSMGCLSVAAQALWPEQVFGFLLNSTGAVLVFMYLTIAVSQLRLRTRTEPARLTFTMWGFPFLTYATIAALLAVLVSMLFLESARPQLLMSLGSLVVVLSAYAVHSRRR